MPPILFNFVAWGLLFVQGLVSIGAGQTLCIPFASCRQHTCGESGHHHHGHGDLHGHAHHGHHHHGACSDRRGVDRHGRSHHHGVLGSCGGAHVECGCHLHVALPESELPWRPVDSDANGAPKGESRRHSAACSPNLANRPDPPPWPEVFLASDQTRARAMTRLLL